MARIPITLFSTAPIRFFTKYFYATTNGGDKNIFDSTTTSAPITSKFYEDYDAIATLINPLKTENVLRADGNDLLVPLGGMLVIPDTSPTNKWPLVMIGHGNAFGYFEKEEPVKPVFDGNGNVVTKGQKKFTVFPGNEVTSYAGYAEFQDHLASQGIASFSFNLNIVNSIENSEEKPFDQLAVDVNQRILLFFLHLKLLKILAGDPLTIPTSGDKFPIKFYDGSTLVNLADALADTTSPNGLLMALKDLLTNNIDFSKLGIMGHSRGADMVSRIPAYFHRSGTINGPTFAINTKVDERIRILSEQLSKPEQDTLKIIFALEPVATKNEIDPNNHGYVINKGETLYMVGVGTHDEDVSLDPVRIYEYPQCPKIMIAINGASHKRFNSVWYEIEKKADKKKNPLEQPKVKLNLLKFEKQQAILQKVYGACFIATLLNKPALLLDIIHKKLDIDLPYAINFQIAWKFGPALNLLNSPGTPEKVLKTSSFKFEQEDIEVYYIEKNNEGNAVVKVPISGTGINLSSFTHFSFRFAKGFSLSSKPERIEEKNFTIQCFENDTPIGKVITGADIDTVELKALQAFDEAEKINTKPEFTYSILLQTMEIGLSSFSKTDLNRVNRIDITVIPDDTKPPPNSTSKIILGSLGGAILGAFAGSLGAAITLAIINDDDVKRESNKWMAIAGGGGAVIGGVVAIYHFLPDDNAFVFEDFLLTNRP